MKKYSILFILLIALQFVSCYSDKGNYDYKEVNAVTISELPDEQVVKIQYGGVLEIEPKITSTLNQNEDNYTYRWVAYPKGGVQIDGKDTFELSVERNLSCNIELPQGEFIVYFYVMDTKTGIEHRNSFPLKVTSATRDGWLVLQSEEGRTRLDMISKVGDEEYHLSDILARSAMPYTSNPKMILIESDMMLDAPDIILATDNGTTYLDRNTLQWSDDKDFKYHFGDAMSTVKISYVRAYYSEGNKICLSNENIYSRSVFTNGSIYGVPVNKLANESGYLKLAPFMGTNPGPYSYNNPIVVYDTENKRFIQVTDSRNGCIVPTAVETVFSNTTGKDMVTMISTNHNGGTIYPILKDNNNKIWLYGFEVSGPLKQAEKYYYQIEAPNIEDATMFAIHPYYYYMFYVAGNKLYQFDLTTKAYKEIALSVGEEISMIKFNMLFNGDYQKPNWYKEIPYSLIVGSTKIGGKPSENGTVRMFHVDNRFDANLKLLKQYDGYAKPVDVTYRER